MYILQRNQATVNMSTFPYVYIEILIPFEKYNPLSLNPKQYYFYIETNLSVQIKCLNKYFYNPKNDKFKR